MIAELRTRSTIRYGPKTPNYKYTQRNLVRGERGKRTFHVRERMRTISQIFVLQNIVPSLVLKGSKDLSYLLFSQWTLKAIGESRKVKRKVIFGQGFI